MRTASLSLVLVLSLSALADDISIWPLGPTSATPVEVRIPLSCTFVTTGSSFERSGSLIRVQLKGRSEICDPGVLDHFFAAPIGTLPPGSYRVEASYPNGPVIGSTTFTVRNASPAPIAVHPFAVANLGGARVVIEAIDTNNRSLCTSENCATTTIRVGDTEVRRETLQPYGAGGVSFFSPARAGGGLVDVTVKVGELTFVAPAGLYFIDRGAPPDLSVFERVLFPVLTRTAGAFDSMWISEAALANPKPYAIETFNQVDPRVCIDFPCGERLEAGEVRRFEGEGHPQGVALLAPRSDVRDLSFSLRVRDTSRAAHGFGTQVPVVREAQMFDGAMTILDVPVDPRYRARLRVYQFVLLPPLQPSLGIDMVRANGQKTQLFVQPGNACSGISCAWTPYFRELELPAGAADERVNLYLTVHPAGSMLAWAFVSVTNNTTQEVTVALPDGEGGVPVR